MWLKTFKHRYIKLKTEQRFGRLAVEIALVLVLKFLLLWLLWWLCFSHAPPKEARQAAVTRMILNR